MKTIKISIISMKPTADGGAVLITKPSKENPSENGVHVLKAAQVARISQRCLGFVSIIALQQAIAVSNGGAILSIDATECKVGQAWENKVTGEHGIYGQNPDGTMKEGAKDWTKYNNHEIELGMAASMKIFEVAITAGVNQAAYSVQPVKQVAKQPELGIAATTNEEVTA